MAFGVLSTASNNSPVSTNGNNPVALLSTSTVTTGDVVLQFLGFAHGAYSDSGTFMQVSIDGVVVATANAFGSMVATTTVSSGSHNIDFTVISQGFDVTIGERGLTVLSLG